jgi:hypothetical protein
MLAPVLSYVITPLYSQREIDLTCAYIQVPKAPGYHAKTAASKPLNAQKGSQSLLDFRVCRSEEKKFR